MSYSVGQVAGFAGVTVRTLHHYDDIGLLVPSERSRAGHRRYNDADLDRLQQILFYRELGFPLDEVAALLDDPAADPRAHLRRQHELLSARIEKLQKMAAAVEQAMEARSMGINLTPEEKFEVFGDFDPDEHQEEVRERWGDTDAYRQSQQRTASYTKEDWQRIQDEADELTRRFVALMDAGEPADSEGAMDVAEDHRLGIARNHYDCGYEMHTCLGEMYVSDERFTRNIDAARQGLAVYMRDAILANAVPYAHTSVPTSAAAVTSKRNASTALAPRARACSTSRPIASLRVSTSVLVSPRSSPPTIDFSPAPIWLPRCRERTVSPKTSPSTSCTRWPGRSFVVTTSTSGRGPCPPPYSSMLMVLRLPAPGHGAHRDARWNLEPDGCVDTFGQPVPARLPPAAGATIP